MAEHEPEQRERLTMRRGARRGTTDAATRIVCPPDDGSWRSELNREEAEALEELKKHPAAQGYTDKYLVVFLLARKLDVSRTIFLLETNREWRVKYGLTEPVQFQSLNMDLVRRMWAFTMPGTRDKSGRGLFYLLPSNFEPARYTAEEHRAFFVWLWELMFQQESVDFHRNGILLVCDMSRSGWRNFNWTSMKELLAIYQNHFPGRIKQILLVNPPAFIRFCVQVTRVFVKTKFVQRMMLLDSTERVKLFVDPTHLITRLGGSLEHDHVQWMEQMMRQSATAAAASASASRRSISHSPATAPSVTTSIVQHSDGAGTSASATTATATIAPSPSSPPASAPTAIHEIPPAAAPASPESVAILQLPPEAMSPKTTRAMHHEHSASQLSLSQTIALPEAATTTEQQQPTNAAVL